MDRSVDLSSPNSLRTDDAQMADHVEGPHVLENFGAQGQRQPTFLGKQKWIKEEMNVGINGLNGETNI